MKSVGKLDRLASASSSISDFLILKMGTMIIIWSILSWTTLLVGYFTTLYLVFTWIYTADNWVKLHWNTRIQKIVLICKGAVLYNLAIATDTENKAISSITGLNIFGWTVQLSLSQPYISQFVLWIQNHSQAAKILRMSWLVIRVAR